MTANVWPQIGAASEPRALGLTSDVLGECALWWPERSQLYWTDVRGKAVHSLDVNTGEVRHRQTPELTGGMCLTDGDRLLVAMERHLALLDPDTGALDLLASPREWREGMRFNEMKTDPRGRTLAGYMDDLTKDPTGWLFRLDPEGFVPLVEGVSVANSLVWSPAGTTMYFADGVDPVLWRFDYDVESGVPSGRRALARLEPGRGIHDGAAVDVAGHVWSANYGGSSLIRYTPEGVIDTVVPLPVSQPTSCAFGGDDLDLLFVTTARQRMEPEKLAAEPTAGDLFVLRTDVPGLPVPRAIEALLPRSVA